MKTKENEEKNRLHRWRSLYESALMAHSDLFATLERHMQQYLGSDEIDGSPERAKTVRNITYEIIESEISADIPLPKADAESFSERHEENAKSIERLCASVRDRLPFEEENDLDERYTYIYGGSVWYVEWDSELSGENFRGGVSVRCLSPLSFIPQP